MWFSEIVEKMKAVAFTAYKCKNHRFHRLIWHGGVNPVVDYIVYLKGCGGDWNVEFVQCFTLIGKGQEHSSFWVGNVYNSDRDITSKPNQHANW